MAEQQGSNSQPQGKPQQAQQPPQAPIAPYPYPYQDDEISLYELWNTLVERRLLIGAVFLLTTVVAAAYALTRTPTYQFDAVIEVGQVPSFDEAGMQRIESPRALASRLNELIIPRVMEKRGAGEAAAQVSEAEVPGQLPVPAAEVLNEDAGLLRVAVAIPAEAAEAMNPVLRGIVDAVVDMHDHQLATQRERLEQRVADLRAELQTLKETRERVSIASPNSDSGSGGGAEQPGSNADRQLAAMLEGIVETLVSRDINSDFVRLNETVASLEARLSSLQSTAMVRPPAIADSPEGQPPTTIIALGAVLGLMLGVFAAFGREFVANAAEQT
ncbi:Wzz/FepE/Etk N-terminal domain-containing protein [Spiribacter pallidus]|uniref:Wzz/FepE/Etk N-terminal domain-containing protein n=1 Tax=Spiribacter pallidus TaxID=1987936 RepID=A0ABV3TFA9_9GAMM